MQNPMEWTPGLCHSEKGHHHTLVHGTQQSPALCAAAKWMPMPCLSLCFTQLWKLALHMGRTNIGPRNQALGNFSQAVFCCCCCFLVSAAQKVGIDIKVTMQKLNTEKLNQWLNRMQERKKVWIPIQKRQTRPRENSSKMGTYQESSLRPHSLQSTTWISP